MNNRNQDPSNKELAIAAAALTAAASLVGASAIYAANNSAGNYQTGVSPKIESTPSAYDMQIVTETSKPTPTVVK
jgi:hypothetical protein